MPFNVREGCSWLATSVVEGLFEYDTPKFVHIKSKKVGVINRLVQLAILGYVIGYGIIYQKSYQETEIVQSIVTTKVKGASLASALDPDQFSHRCSAPLESLSAFDHTDLVVPPHEPNGFFVTTNVWVTCNQSINTCGEDPKISFCNETVPCEAGKLLRGGNGITTGACSDENSCEIKGWCPLEDENSTFTNLGPVIDIRNFTVLIKNSISFPRLSPHFKLRNIPKSAEKDYLEECEFDPHSAKGRTCPIFRLQQILDMYNDSDSYYNDLATKGGVIGLRIHWDCNLDRSPEHCKPEYSARRLDNPTSQISPGFNFRFPRYYYVDGVQHRDVWKAYGIWFVVEVTGQGGSFSFTKLVLALGSTIGLLAIATVVTDTVALYVLRKGVFYKKKKYQQIERGDDNHQRTTSMQSEGDHSETDSLKQPLKGDSPPTFYGGKMD